MTIVCMSLYGITRFAQNTIQIHIYIIIQCVPGWIEIRMQNIFTQVLTIFKERSFGTFL